MREARAAADDEERTDITIGQLRGALGRAKTISTPGLDHVIPSDFRRMAGEGLQELTRLLNLQVATLAAPEQTLINMVVSRPSQGRQGMKGLFP